MGATLRLTLAFLYISSSACAVALDDVLFNITLPFVNSTSLLSEQLQLVANLSLGLARKRTHETGAADIEDISRLLAVNKDKNLTNILLAAERTALGATKRLGGGDPIVAILTRRALLAYLANLWILLGRKPLSSQAGRSLGNIAKALYGNHVTSVSRKRVIEYLHISKSGGTSFSYAARLNQCGMPGGIGQPLDLGDVPRWINRTAFAEVTKSVRTMWSVYGRVERQGSVHGCEERLDYAVGHGYQYVSNEYTLHGGDADMGRTHVCPQVVNVVTLRDPEKRLSSHLHFMLAHLKKRLFRRKRKKSVPDRFHDTFCTSNATVWEGVSPAVLDNYIVRSFLGGRGFHTPIWGIGTEHVAVATRMLLQFDLVLDLDAGNEASDLAMHQGLGWNVTLSDVHARALDDVAKLKDYSPEECSNEALLRKVLARQEPDKQLYRLGQVVSLLDRLLLALARELGLQPQGPAQSGTRRSAAEAAPAAAPVASAAKEAAPTGSEGSSEGSSGDDGSGGEEGSSEASDGSCGLLAAPDRTDAGSGPEESTTAGTPPEDE